MWLRSSKLVTVKMAMTVECLMDGMVMLSATGMDGREGGCLDESRGLARLGFSL